MRRLLIALAASAALTTASAASAVAQGEDHNCAGATVSSLAGPGFGTGVSGAAQLQAVDNFGFANCGAPPRQNP